ncbi:MAG: hypothetical protein Q9224_004780, partial [Gallowayella concinna]
MRIFSSLIVATALSTSVFAYPHQDSGLRPKRLSLRTDHPHSNQDTGHLPNGRHVSESGQDTHSKKGADLTGHQGSTEHNDGGYGSQTEENGEQKNEKKPCTTSTDANQPSPTPTGNTSDSQFGDHPEGLNPFGDHPEGLNPFGDHPQGSNTAGTFIPTITPTTTAPYSYSNSTTTHGTYGPGAT